jgi:hypothetical protein
LPKGKDGVRSAKKKRHGRTKGLPDLHPILGRFSDALSMVVVAYRALDERASDIEAATVLAQGIASLNAVYTEIDLASIQLIVFGVARFFLTSVNRVMTCVANAPASITSGTSGV